MMLEDNAPDELEKLLSDVQRTILDNAQFIRNLKEETAGSVVAETQEKCTDGPEVDDNNYEEL